MANEQDKPFEQTKSGNSTSSASPGQNSAQTSTSSAETSKAQDPNRWLCESVARSAAGIGDMVSDAATQASKAALETAQGVSSTIGAVAGTGQAVVETAAGVGEAIAKEATQASQAAFESATEIADRAAKQAQELFERATKEAGRAASFVGDNVVLRNILRAFRADWLLGAFGQVDTQKAAEAVKKLQQEHPTETPNQIAHRVIVEKVMYAGGMGLVSSLVPGVALALLAVDVAVTTVLQAEMVYQIAAAYGMDLKDPARKGEILAIFGLSLGGSEALKAGSGLLRNVPLAGVVIGASTNAVMLYTLGYAACRFYEAKVNPLTSQAAAEAIAKESHEYLEVAIAQQAIMDQILVHMVLASNPDKAWSDILPELQKLNFTPASLKAIADHIQSPQPLQALLLQLNRDFSIPLLAQCYRIAQLDGVTTDKEAQVINAIAAKFEVDLKTIEAVINSEADGNKGI